MLSEVSEFLRGEVGGFLGATYASSPKLFRVDSILPPMMLKARTLALIRVPYVREYGDAVRICIGTSQKARAKITKFDPSQKARSSTKVPSDFIMST